MLVQKIFGIMRKDVCEKNISTFPKKLLASKAENFVRAYKMVVDVAPHAPWLHPWFAKVPDQFTINPFFPTVPTFAVRETASLGIMGAPRVPSLNPSETIVF